MQARCAGTPSESAPARAARYVQLRSRSMWCASRLQVYRAAQSHWLAILTSGADPAVAIERVLALLHARQVPRRQQHRLRAMGAAW